MPIGRPLSLTPNTTNRDLSVTATAGQTVFTVTGGYRINQIDVFRNGVKLTNISDFTAVNGSTVELADAATLNDEISFEIIIQLFQVSQHLLEMQIFQVSQHLLEMQIFLMFPLQAH